MVYYILYSEASLYNKKDYEMFGKFRIRSKDRGEIKKKCSDILGCWTGLNVW